MVSTEPIDSHTTTVPVMDIKTIADFLVHTATATDSGKKPIHKLRKGSDSVYYALPDMPHYVLRVGNHTSIDQLLKQYSALTPPKHLVLGANIGQTWLSTPGNAVSIQSRPDGMLLQDYIAQCECAHGMQKGLLAEERVRIHSKATLDAMDSINRFGTAESHNPFVPLYERAYQLAKLGYRPNFRLSNIFIDLDAKELNIVNQLDEPFLLMHSDKPIDMDALFKSLSGQFISELKPDAAPLQAEERHRIERVFNENPLSINDTDHARLAYAQLLERISTAKDYVLSEYQENKFPLSPLMFSQNTHTKGVRLDHPPHALIWRLKQLADDVPDKNRPFAGRVH